jgi:hypothetical protein
MEPKTTSARNSFKTRETSLCPDGAHPGIESLRSGVREQRIVISADRRKRVAEAVEEYIAYVHGLAGTKA